MVNSIFVCEKKFFSCPIADYIRKFFTVLPVSFSIESISAYVKEPSTAAVFIYLQDLSPQSEAELKKLWQQGCSKPVIFIGNRENCVKHCEMGSLIVKQYIYTPIDQVEFLGLIRHIANEIEGKDDPKNEFGNVIPVAVEPKHVLVVDDDAISLRTMMNWLKDTYRLSVVKSGSAAINFLEEETPDLILLDYEMPDYNGPETLKIIRTKKKNENIPVIFLTGVTDSDMIKNAIMQKPQGYILKTTTRENLLEKIRDILKVR